MHVRVGLLWHSLASGNLGVCALTLAQLGLLDEIAEEVGAEIDVVMFVNPVARPIMPLPFDSERVRVGETVPLSARSLSAGLPRIAGAFRRCDLLIDIAEGDSFTDVYGARRYVKQVASKLISLATRTPLVLAPQTIGPFRSRATRALPALILRRAEAVFARDRPSAAFAAQLAPSTVVQIAADLAVRLPYERGSRDDGPVRVGLNVSGLLYNLRAEKDRFGLRTSYARLVDRLIAEFVSREACELHLVPHVAVGEAGDEDAATCAALAERHEGVQLAPAFSDPRDAKSYIARMDFFIGARMHACIAAYSAGVPLLPLAYTRKATGLFESLDYPVVGDLTSADENELFQLALRTFEDRRSLVPALERGNAVAADRLHLYRQCLTELVRARGR